MIDVLVIPTAGFDRFSGRPSPQGIKRIEKAVSLIMQKQTRVVAIIGGVRSNGPSEADLYMSYIREHYPELLYMTTWIIRSTSTCTNRDLEVFSDTDKTVSIGIISYEEHLNRMTITLRFLGFNKIFQFESGESRGYTRFMEWVLTALTRIDPTWSWFLPCLFLVWMANRRLNETLIGPSS